MTTQINGLTAVNITPARAKFSDPTDCTAMGIRIFNDNLHDSCNIYWVLFYPVVTTSKDTEDKDIETISYISSAEGNLVIEGENYTSWQGDNAFPFSFSGKKLGLTIV